MSAPTTSDGNDTGILLPEDAMSAPITSLRPKLSRGSCLVTHLKVDAGTGQGTSGRTVTAFFFAEDENCCSPASYRIYHGPITNGLWVLHDCDRKICVHPAHLHLGTHTDNMTEWLTEVAPSLANDMPFPNSLKLTSWEFGRAHFLSTNWPEYPELADQ